MDAGTLGTISTLLVTVAFAGVCWWAFAPRRKKRFEEASKLPFERDANDPDTSDSDTSPEEEQAEQDQTKQNDISRRDEE